jgi:hypothetical protein
MIDDPKADDVPEDIKTEETLKVQEDAAEERENNKGYQ